MVERLLEKVEITSAAKSRRWNKRPYRSAKALRHPKANFFRTLLAWCCCVNQRGNVTKVT